MSEIAIKAQNVSKIYSQGLFRKKYKLVLDNINLEVKKGDRLVIIGESGMGKTTLARILANLDAPSSGDVYWFGTSLKDVNGNEYKHLRKKFSMFIKTPMHLCIHQRPFLR